MTTQRRTLIDLTDIVAVEYECPHCQARCSIPINRADRRIDKCQNCNESWFTARQTGAGDLSDDQLFSMFLDRLKQVQGRTFGAIIRLQVAAE